MSYDVLGPGALDYLPCRYGASKLLFRGPKRDLMNGYVAFIGGTETYGKFIKRPFPALVERDLGTICANFGFLNAGVDAFVNDPFVIDAGMRARATVIQVMGAQNMSNRFYSVHPRRNDRFVKASTLLSTIYREVDFSEFHFTKHMLSHLHMVSAERFEALRMELQQAWLARMRLMLGRITGKTVLLWLSPAAPPEDGAAAEGGLGPNPLFVTRQMMDELTPLVTRVVEVKVSPAAIAAGTDGMVFSQMEAPAAGQMLGPQAHQEAAMALAEVLEPMI